MIARLFVLLPFHLTIPEGEEFLVDEYEDSGYKVRVFPPMPHSALNYRPPAPEAIQASYPWITAAHRETGNYKTLTLKVVQ